MTSEFKKPKMAVICRFAGIINRGGESFAIELGKYLSKYYEVDMYTEGTAIDGFPGNIVTIDYKPGGFLQWLSKAYDKNEGLRKFLRCSRYTYVGQPGTLEGYGFGKACFKKMETMGDYEVMSVVTGPGPQWCARKYRKKHGTPFFSSCEGGIGPGEWWVLKSNPDCYVALTTPQFEWAKAIHKNVDFIPNGTYVSDYEMEVADEDKVVINKGHKLIISVGHLDTDFKRHQLAIEAVSRLEEVDLLIVGDGPAKAYFEELGEKLMPGRLRVEKIPHSEIVRYYKSADVFTLPSLDEPFGIVYIEALASGLPCVATDDAARREIIGEAGVVCDVEDADAYAEAFRKALVTDWGNKHLEQAKKFDYSVVGEKYYQMIGKIRK